jgi:hypothetical protein
MRDYKAAVYSIILLVAVSWATPICLAQSETEAKQNIDQAEHDLAVAYGAVAETSTTGADIFQLVLRLNTSAELLTDANNAFNMGDYGNASSYAVECSIQLAGLVEDAQLLKAQTEAAFNTRLLFTLSSSGAALGVLIVLGVVCWRFLKRRYLRQMLKMKPEVVESNEHS